MVGFGELFCPHYCISCGKVGGIICDCCKKNNIVKNREKKCLNCKSTVLKGICSDEGCRLRGVLQVYVGGRTGVLKDLINLYKYKAVRAAGGVLANLFADACADKIVKGFTIVALPTTGQHIRRRGFGHTEKLAKLIAKRLDMVSREKVLVRNNKSVQVGASEEMRKMQAELAYALGAKFCAHEKYLLIDDVWTTGSSMLAAQELLVRNGARNVAVGVLARSNHE